MSTYYLLRIGAAISRAVPVTLLYALAGLAARAVALLPTDARAAARTNIARVMGLPSASGEVRRAAARALRCQALNYVDLMRMDAVTKEEYEATVAHGDLAAFSDAVAEGKGVIIVSAHVGNVDYVAQWLALHGYEVHALMERLEPERLLRLVQRQRTAAGLRIHPIGPDSIALLTRVLRAGGVVALVADRDIGGGEPVTFFGAEARLPIGPVLLSLRTGAPLLPAFGYRLRDNRLYLTVFPPIRLQRTRDLRADLRAGLRAVAQALEEGIARAPGQWIVFEPVWDEREEELAA